MPKSDPLKPSVTALCKLGSIIVHAEELADPKTAHFFDKVAFTMLLKDPEVVEWMAGMKAMAMLPVKRSERKSG